MGRQRKLHLIYLIGGPGSGKTTVLETLLNMPGTEQQWAGWDDPFPYLARDELILLGRRRPGFGGTDTLSMNIARVAEAWITSTPARVVCGEGDRLAYPGFFDAARAAGYQLNLIYLDTHPVVAHARSVARADELHVKPQNEAWVKGRNTKAFKLASRYGAHVVNGDLTVPEVVTRIRIYLRNAGNPLGDIAAVA
jgi:hypothetical protein